MSTQGQDFFDSEWFNDHTVFIVDAGLDELKYDIYLNDSDIENFEDKELATSITNGMHVKLLGLPLNGERNKVVHHFEKILWLIQSYCKKGWTNTIKAVNHLDNGQFIVHPGTNRCLAAKFLKLETLRIMLSVHKEQKLYEILKGNVQEIDNEKELRNSLESSDTILFRTEVEERLFVNGVSVEGKTFKDFTYEFLGSDAWPERSLPSEYKGFAYSKIEQWSNLVARSLPLNVFVTENIEHLDSSLEMNFTNIVTGLEHPLEVNYIVVDSIDDVCKNNRYQGLAVFLDKNIDQNPLELLFFADPQECIASTKDKKVAIINTEHPANLTAIGWDKSITIPDSYVR